MMGWQAGGGLSPRYYGKYAGLVEDNADPDKLGRLKVKVPAIFGEDLSVWARPCFASGHFFVPPAKTPLWVEFEAGDPEFPIWVGIFYTSSTLPIAAALNPPDNRVIHSVSGHVIEVMDKDKEERITVTHMDGKTKLELTEGAFVVTTKDGAKLRLDKDAITAENADHLKVTLDKSSFTIDGGSGMKIMLKGGTLTLSGNKIVLDAKQVELGTGAAQSLVCGTTMEPLWQQLWLMLATHTHPTAAPGPPSPPLPPIVPPTTPILSTSVKTSM